MKVLNGFLLALVFLSSQSLAAENEPAELLTRFPHYYTSYSINEDGSFTESREWSRTILNERVLESSKRASVTYSTSIQNAEVVDAYTRKADGRRIDVPKSNYQLEVNSGKGADSPVYSDQTTLSVVFPDVSVGDTVFFSYRLINKEAIFPGHFSTIGVFPRQTSFDDVRVRFDWPSSLWVQFEARELTEVAKNEKAGRKQVEWSFQNKTPLRSKRRNYSVYDVEKEPGYSFSTFRTYDEISKAYGERAHPKAAVTDRVRKLADDIARNKKNQREQARSLYDWVATKINYAGNCIGIGAVVPRDLDFVLDNRIGDCKDHATLLEALLAAKGIESKQALINASNSYKLNRIPVVSMVNHVINYIPSLNLYVDSTSETTPFGMLPFSSEDKPVILVDGTKPGARTPPSLPGSNQQHMKTVVKIHDDGSVEGDVEISLKGGFAVDARDRMRDLPKEQEEELVKNVLQGMGYIGTGKFDKDDAQELLDNYHYKAVFSMQDFVQMPGAGAFRIQPIFYSEAPIANFLGAAVEPVEPAEVTCSNGSSTEEYVYYLPKSVKVLSVPEDMKVKNDFLSYSATYRLKGNTLKIKRDLVDNTVGNVCKPSVFEAYKKFALKVQQNIKAQVVYR